MTRRSTIKTRFSAFVSCLAKSAALLVGPVHAEQIRVADALYADAENTADIAEMLASELEQWLRNLAPKGIVPRAFTGVKPDGRQFVITLNELQLDHVERRRFLIWLCRQETLMAYAYATHVGKANTTTSPPTITEAVDIYASSLSKDVAILLDLVETSHDNGIEYHQTSQDISAAGVTIGPFFGLHRVSEVISEVEQAKFANIWKQLSSTAFWRVRS